MNIKSNLSGKKFNRLTVVSPTFRKVGERTKYICKCDCGNECVVEGSKIKNGHTRSCGCIKNEIYRGYNKSESGIASRNSLIYTYKYNAKRRNVNFDLTDEQMIEMFESDCFYCGREPHMASFKKRSNGAYIYTGIDRMDNNPKIGYTLQNTVPCCSKCNYFKNKMNYDEFIEWVYEIYQNLNSKGLINN
jgi:hypothetical protein